MNRQRAIITLLEQEIATAITTANGYYNTVAKVIRKSKDLDEITEFPTVWFQIEGETREITNLATQENERNVTFEYPEYIPKIKKKLSLLMCVAIESEVDIEDEGLLSQKADIVAEDIDDYFHNNKPVSCGLNSIDWVQVYFVQRVEPILDDKLNKGSIAFRIYIEYIDNEEKIDVDILDAPTITAPSNGSIDQLRHTAINWTAIDDALSYELQVSTDIGYSDIVVNQPYILAKSYTVSSTETLTNGTVYYARVRAYGSYGFSLWSETVAFTVNEQTVIPIDWTDWNAANSWYNSFGNSSVHSTSNSVSAMVDHIANRNLTQTLTNNKPSLSGNAWGSLSSVYFNPNFLTGVHYLNYNDTGGVFNWDNSTSGSFTLWFMVDGRNFDINSGYFCPFSRSNTNYGSQFALIRGVNTAQPSNVLAYPYSNNDYIVAPILPNIPHHLIASHSGSASTVYLDGNKIGTLNRSLTQIANNIGSYLNLGSYYDGPLNHQSGKFTGHIFAAGTANQVVTDGLVQQFYEKFKERMNL